MENVIINYEIKEKETLYEGHNKLEMWTVSEDDKEYKREVLNCGNVVAAIVKDTKKNKFIFVEQYRPATEGIMVEVVAGKIDKGEKPEESIKREIMEETGYKVDTISPIMDFYTAPGITNEVVSLFYVEVSEKVNEGGGIDDENISIVEIETLGLGGKIFPQDPFNSEMKMGEEGKIIPPYQLIDAKSIIAVMWYEKNKVLKDMADVITQAKLRSL